MATIETIATQEAIALGQRIRINATEVVCDFQPGAKQQVAVLTGLHPQFRFARNFCTKHRVKDADQVRFLLAGPGVYEYRGLRDGRETYAGFFVVTEDSKVGRIDQGGAHWRVSAPKGV